MFSKVDTIALNVNIYREKFITSNIFAETSTFCTSRYNYLIITFSYTIVQMMAEIGKPQNRSMEGIPLPNAPPKCKWALDKTKCDSDPHSHISQRYSIIYESHL